MMDDEEGVDLVVDEVEVVVEGDEEDEDEEQRRKGGKLPHPRTASFPLCSILRN